LPPLSGTEVQLGTGLCWQLLAEQLSLVQGSLSSQSAALSQQPGRRSITQVPLAVSQRSSVQALVSARNFGIEIDEKVLERGFEYLKKCQNKDGGFDYQLGPGETSMKEGTAADVATLALMEKFDYSVMINGYKFMIKITPAGISSERFPYYGHFYGCMGMRLLGEEFKPYRKQTQGYIDAASRDLISWQQEDGSWPLKGWVQANGNETTDYSTAFAALALSVHEGRLSIFQRTPPKLPEGG